MFELIFQDMKNQTQSVNTIISQISVLLKRVLNVLLKLKQKRRCLRIKDSLKLSESIQRTSIEVLLKSKYCNSTS